MSELTKKLYYDDAYISEFYANVLSVTSCDGGFDVILDQTAFFPEEGGQSSDCGYIAAARVSAVYEKDGIVHHVTDTAPCETNVFCRIDFDERFEKMQIHTAEHILCGIIHKKFGLDNVGFHLGADEVTFDISAPLTKEDLGEVFAEACEVVYKNIRIDAFFPSKDELSDIEYRSKLDLTSNVRLVKIGDVDTCACCAPHVRYTGEIGQIRFVFAEKHRGGMRIWMSAGRRAMRESFAEHDRIMKISAMLSVPTSDADTALEKYMSDTENLKYQLKEARRIYAESLACALSFVDGNLVYFVKDAGIDELRSFVNCAIDKVSCILVALCGCDGDYKYVIASNSVDVAKEVKAYNAALNGRGGGRGFAVQGSFSSTFEEIKAYFEK